jgi:hypothetical protein
MAILRLSTASIKLCTLCECGAVTVRYHNGHTDHMAKQQFNDYFGVNVSTCAKKEITWACKKCI